MNLLDSRSQRCAYQMIYWFVKCIPCSEALFWMAL